jgi:Fic family protein
MKSPDRRSEGIAHPRSVRQADADYQGFPSFEEWSKISVDAQRWEEYAARLPEHGRLSSDQLKRAQDVARRAAAVDTGAIEGLYEVDRGFTFTVATQAAMWEAAVNEKGPEVRALIESQLEAYVFVLDMATQATPVTEAWIRALHAQITAGQEFYLVQSEAGPQRQKLAHGEYKLLPNHVQRPDGKIHFYAPVDLTPAEMNRLVSELQSEAFLEAHPVLRASYAHYALTVVHPFADGNGRVARALASVFTYRSNRIPLLVLADTRAEYISALEAADRGAHLPLVDFVAERGIDAILLVEQCLQAADSPQASGAVAAIEKLYTTRGGFTHDQVDQAGISFFEALEQEAERQVSGYQIEGQLTTTTIDATANTTYDVYPSTHRLPMRGGHVLRITAATQAPADTRQSISFSLEVPRDADTDDDVIIRNLNSQEAFTARVSECTPTLSAAALMRIRIFLERMIGELLQEVSAAATESLGR